MQRNRVAYAIAAALTVALGLLSRSAAMPDWVHAYVGDALYAVLIALLLGIAFPRGRVLLPALLLCFVIEMSQAWHPAWLDAVRAHRVVALVLGRGFVWTDLLCYTAGVGVVAVVERLRRVPPPTSPESGWTRRKGRGEAGSRASRPGQGG